MKKQIIILGIAVLLICVGLSGCEEISDSLSSGDDELVEFSCWEVTTEWYTSHTDIEVKDSFYHDYPDDRRISYVVRGKVKNIAEKPFDRINITAYFFDDKGNQLCNSSGSVSDLYMNETKSFNITVYNRFLYPSCEFFEQVDHYEIEYSVDIHE